MTESDLEITRVDGQPLDLGPRNTFTDIRELDKKTTLHILQYQPTDRPIEDRYSIDILTHENPPGMTVLLLGVYDGHRGFAAAEYVAQALPQEVLSATTSSAKAVDSPSVTKHASSNKRRELDTSYFREIFERFDRQILSTFEHAHPIPKAPRRSAFSSLVSKLRRTTGRPGNDEHRQEVIVDPANTASALRALSGCTASMLLLNLPHLCSEKPSAKIINLGDSRAVVASLAPELKIQAVSIDINSGIKAEQSLIRSQHPDDNSADIFIGGRLFGETLSTRAFGDAMYKLPLREVPAHFGQDITYPILTDDEKHAHRHLISLLSAHQQAGRSSAGKSKAVPLVDRYESLFWGYQSPPYVSARPEVVDVAIDGSRSGQEDPVGVNDKPSLVAILASDGLWDLTTSEEVVSILNEAVSNNNTRPTEDQDNVAQYLLDRVVERGRKHPGDDVTILVLVL